MYTVYCIPYTQDEVQTQNLINSHCSGRGVKHETLKSRYDSARCTPKQNEEHAHVEGPRVSANTLKP